MEKLGFNTKELRKVGPMREQPLEEKIKKENPKRGGKKTSIIDHYEISWLTQVKWKPDSGNSNLTIIDSQTRPYDMW